MGWADAPGTALESKGSMWFLHITPALYLLQAEPPPNVSAQDRTGGVSLKDQRMKKLGLSGTLSSFSNSWQCMSSLREEIADRNELYVREICSKCGAGRRQMLLMAGRFEADKQLGYLNTLTHGVPGPLDQQNITGSS